MEDIRDFYLCCPDSIKSDLLERRIREFEVNYDLEIHISQAYKEPEGNGETFKAMNGSDRRDACIGRMERDFEIADSHLGVLAIIEKGMETFGTPWLLGRLHDEGKPIIYITKTLGKADYVVGSATQIFESLKDFGEDILKRRKIRENNFVRKLC